MSKNILQTPQFEPMGASETRLAALKPSRNPVSDQAGLISGQALAAAIACHFRAEKC
ncbi:MAG: hypothetical protein ACYCSN_17940 [Acidobacteriaceae bacterium]